jgi:predicted RecB family nuclease
MSIPFLSKSKLLAFRQCPKRLWLELHRPDLRQDSAAALTRFNTGYQVGDIARRLYDPAGKGLLIDAQTDGYAAALAQSKAMLDSTKPLFEAGFAAGGALAFADIMIPARKAGKRTWKMIEVKSATKVKDYHQDDTAIQACIALRAGVPLTYIAVAHIDSSWTYPGGGDYQGLLKEVDQTQAAFDRAGEVQSWIADAQSVARKRKEPAIRSGTHCTTPFECGFLAYCRGQEPQTAYPVDWIPGIHARLRTFIADHGITDMRDLPDNQLNEQQQRVKTCTLSGKPYFNAKAASNELAPYALPAYFLDFETIQFAVPIWKGTRPYQQIPFQFSAHKLDRNGKLQHREFLDLSGQDPSRRFAEELVKVCGKQGPIYVYGAGFEGARIRELAARLPRLKHDLQALESRLVDLLPIMRKHYYHPSQEGSWSIKKVLPAIAPDLSYEELDRVQNGGMAMEAYLEAIAAGTSQSSKEQLQMQLSRYCELDTYAMVKLWVLVRGFETLDG